MQYKAVNRSSNYLIHFNKYHDPKNGRFTFAKIGDVVKSVATDVGRGFKGGAKVAVKGVSDSNVGEKLKKVGGGLKSVGSEVGRGFKNATNTVKKELNDQSSINSNSAITKSDNPDDYRTPELDNEYSKLEKSGVFSINKLKTLYNSNSAEEAWGKNIVETMDVGIKALSKTRYAAGDSELEDFADGRLNQSQKNAIRSWFVFEDQTIGMPEVAYLVKSGWSKNDIIKAFKSASEQESKNNEFAEAYFASKKAESLAKPDLFIKLEETNKLEPYKNVWLLSEGYNRMDGWRSDNGKLGEYIDACIEVSNTSASHSIVVDCGKYLIHCDRNRLAKKYAEMNHDMHIM